MRNIHPGTCYYCKTLVKAKEGHFERSLGGWRVIHAGCVFKQRKEKEDKQIAKVKIVK